MFVALDLIIFKTAMAAENHLSVIIYLRALLVVVRIKILIRRFALVVRFVISADSGTKFGVIIH